MGIFGWIVFVLVVWNSCVLRLVFVVKCWVGIVVELWELVLES